LKPEEEDREKIDALLEKAGWTKYDVIMFNGTQRTFTESQSVLAV
jgi:ABC-type transport system substrate-binding protein